MDSHISISFLTFFIQLFQLVLVVAVVVLPVMFFKLYRDRTIMLKNQFDKVTEALQNLKTKE